MREKLTKSRERVKKHGEVYTPEWVVKKMCDNLPPEAWDDIARTFLEPSCGNGNFLAEIYRRKLTLCKTAKDGIEALKSITGIDILPDNCEESRERLKKMFTERFGEEKADEAEDILQRKIICGDALQIMEQWSKEELMEPPACSSLYGLCE